jgi:hypothetical protein
MSPHSMGGGIMKFPLPQVVSLWFDRHTTLSEGEGRRTECGEGNGSEVSHGSQGGGDPAMKR